MFESSLLSRVNSLALVSNKNFEKIFSLTKKGELDKTTKSIFYIK